MAWPFPAPVRPTRGQPHQDGDQLAGALLFQDFPHTLYRCVRGLLGHPPGLGYVGDALAIDQNGLGHLDGRDGQALGSKQGRNLLPFFFGVHRLHSSAPSVGSQSAAAPCW